MNINSKKVLVVSNITDHSGPTEGLVSYLIKKCSLVAVIYHPFFYCREKRSLGRIYIKGKIRYEKYSKPILFSEYLKYLLDLFHTIFYVIKFKNKYDLFIGVNCLHALTGIFLRALGITKKVIFFTIDWVPQRFNNKLFNRLYYAVDKFAVKYSDCVWNLSEEIVDIRKEQKVPDFKNILVPNGVNFEQIKKSTDSDIDRQSMVLLGALHESKGVDLVIETLPLIWNKFPKAKLIVIGSTPNVKGIKPYEKIFREMGNKVKVLGTLSHENILSLMPKYGLGLSPYSPNEQNLSRYASPARVIDYLACSLPVVITKVPLIAKNIGEKNAGIVIEYNPKEFLKAVDKLFTDDDFYFSARQNASMLVKDLSWNNIFDQAFAKL